MTTQVRILRALRTLAQRWLRVIDALRAVRASGRRGLSYAIPGYPLGVPLDGAADEDDVRALLLFNERLCGVALAASDVEAVLGALADFDSSRHHAALDSLFQTAES